MLVSTLVLGLVHIAIDVAILLLIGAIVQWLCGFVGLAIPDLVAKLFIAVVVLIAIYLLVDLFLPVNSSLRLSYPWL